MKRRNKIMTMIKRNNTPVPQNVKENVKKYLEENNLGELVDVMRASDHPEDNYLYHIIAKKRDTYSMWTSWNETTQCLNFGHYGLESEEQAREIHKEFFFRMYGENVID
jgi:hypothetical protein